jgi:hypothetical protein
MPRIRSDGGAVRSAPAGTPGQPIVRPFTGDKPPPADTTRPHDPISAATTSQSAKAETPDPGQYFSLAGLARSWAEVTGEAWEGILHRLGDWAITDAFPDDAFLTDLATGISFHKRGIFDRMRWHRDLVDKIRRVQDCKERDRLQKFADEHIKAAEIALVRRDVVVEACRAMNVAPPPSFGFVEGVCAEHRVPPECPLDLLIGVFAREAERDPVLLCQHDVMPPDEADGYTLLWDAAAQMSRANGRSLERNWLRLMDAFWRSDLSREGLIYVYPGRPGREFVVLDRTALGGLLLGHRDLDAEAAKIESLRQWAVADYLGQPAPFDFFQKNAEGRFGLAVLTRDLDRWRQDIASARLPSEDTPSASSLSSSSSGGATDADRAKSSHGSPRNSRLQAAIKGALKDLGTPGKNAQWKPFCDRVRAECEAKVTTRGFGNRTIERAVRDILKITDPCCKTNPTNTTVHDMSDLS